VWCLGCHRGGPLGGGDVLGSGPGPGRRARFPAPGSCGVPPATSPADRLERRTPGLVEVLVAIAGLPLDIITLILVAIGTFIGAATWIATSGDRRARQRKDEKIKDLEDNPFTHLQCWIKRAEGPILADWWRGEITSSEADGRDPDYKASGDVLALAKGQHFIYIQAFARMGATVHKANLRFLDEDEPRPQVMTLRAPSLRIDDQRYSSDTQGGRNLDHEITVSEGRAINYTARIGIEAEYTGELGLRLELLDTGRAYFLKIPCTTQEPPTQAPLPAPARPWWKFWK